MLSTHEQNNGDWEEGLLGRPWLGAPWMQRLGDGLWARMQGGGLVVELLGVLF